ncbi:MAG: glucose-1-phosphate adenylyltransferase [Verrucomicrobiales bacterium]|nr:glucose-1-phosphate adenylyltransferase [Verrucomicrobiales bacterium]
MPPVITTSEATRTTLAIIMGGGRGSRLHPLTHKRSKPAVPLAGKYRLVDIPISNCLNSDIRQMYVLTQYNSESLNRHVTGAYKFDHFGHNFVHILAAQQTPTGDSWYQGTADAVRQNLDYFLEGSFKYFLILSGDQLYRMDFKTMIRDHLKNDADLTIATTPVRREPARSFGLMETDEQFNITRFVEKPEGNDKLLDELKMPSALLKQFGVSEDEERFQASMGIYLFNRQTLIDALDNDFEDFGKDIIPNTIEKKKVFSHVFQGYWEDIGTIKSFYEANIELTKVVPSYNFFDAHNQIYTRARFLPASKINNAHIQEALISDGCIISNATIQRSLIGVRSVIETGCYITDSVIMGSDYYNEQTVDGNGKTIEVPIRIGANSRIHKAIIDKNAQIGNNVVIDPGNREDQDTEYCCIREGVIVIPKGTVIPDGTVV